MDRRTEGERQKKNTEIKSQRQQSCAYFHRIFICRWHFSRWCRRIDSWHEPNIEKMLISFSLFLLLFGSRRFSLSINWIIEFFKYSISSSSSTWPSFLVPLCRIWKFFGWKWFLVFQHCFLFGTNFPHIIFINQFDWGIDVDRKKRREKWWERDEMENEMACFVRGP